MHRALDKLTLRPEVILVDGNPLKDINLMVDYEKNFVLIIKDGKIYKNTLDK
jgi:imidazolonepropionase-like amidohydrolase